MNDSKRIVNMNCKTKKFISCIICPRCNENYIGVSQTQLTLPVSLHKQRIKDSSLRNVTCSKHLNICVNGKFKIFRFYKLDGEDEQLRKAN